MAQQTMYVGQIGSPLTTLSAGINSSVTTVPVTSAAVLPDAPNLATIGTGSTAEVVLYTGKSGNDLTGCTRGFGGSSATSWDSGTPVGRFYTTYDQNTFRANILDIANQIGAASGIATLDSNSFVTSAQLATTYTDLRAQATTKEDVGLGNATNASSETIRTTSTEAFRVEVRTDDPTSPALGRVWLRSDL